MDKRVNLNIKKPWQGLGIDVNGTMKLDEVLSVADLNFTVAKRPIQVCGGKKIEGIVANVRTDTNEVIGVVGNRYEIVQNTEAFNFLDDMVSGGMEFVSANMSTQNSKAWILGRLNPINIMGDEIVPHVFFSNNFDGKSGIKLSVCMLRTWCQNGMSYLVPSAKFSWTIRHTKTAFDKIRIAQDNFRRIENYAGAFSETMEILQQKALPSIGEFAEFLYPLPEEASKRQFLNIETQRELLMDIYSSKEDIKPFQNTAYGAFMALTDVMTHASPMRASEKFEERRFLQIMEGVPIYEKAQSFFEVL